MVAAGLGMVALTAAAQADAPLTKGYAYKCIAVVNPDDPDLALPLGPEDGFDVPVEASTTLPDSVYAGQVVPSRAVDITLILPEVLRDATVNLLRGVQVDGSSTDSYVALTSAGRTVTQAIPNLSAPRTDIPTTADTPWLVPATGTVPEITVASDVQGSVVMSMPTHFTIRSTVYKRSTVAAPIPVQLTCTSAESADLTLGTVPVVIDKTFAYACDLYQLLPDGTRMTNPLMVDRAVGVRVQFVAPATATQGTTIPPTAVKITLAMPESLRNLTYNGLASLFFQGGTADSKLQVDIGDSTEHYLISGLQTEKLPVPATRTPPWMIETNGMAPEIPVPVTAANSANLSMPSDFTINARLFRYDGDEDNYDPSDPDTWVPNGEPLVELPCHAPVDRALTTIPIVAAPTTPTTTAPPTVKPPTPKNIAPKFAKRAYLIKAKKNRAKSIVVRATDANRDRVTYRATKTPKGKVIVRGSKVTFKPKKNWKGKTSFWVVASDGKGGTAKVKVTVKVR